MLCVVALWNVPGMLCWTVVGTAGALCLTSIHVFVAWLLCPCRRVVFDEGHALKNVSSGTTKAAVALPAPHRWVVTVRAALLTQRNAMTNVQYRLNF